MLSLWRCMDVLFNHILPEVQTSNFCHPFRLKRAWTWLRSWVWWVSLIFSPIRLTSVGSLRMFRWKSPKLSTNPSSKSMRRERKRPLPLVNLWIMNDKCGRCHWYSFESYEWWMRPLLLVKLWIIWMMIDEFGQFLGFVDSLKNPEDTKSGSSPLNLNPARVCGTRTGRMVLTFESDLT